jgi:SAM-dependent methyltransferase
VSYQPGDIQQPILPAVQLDYFVEWGGRSWTQSVSDAFTEFVGNDLRGSFVLDIGTRFGKMACLFALRGAKVIGTEISAHGLAKARRESAKWHVEDRVLFVMCSGSLDHFREDSFDIIFTKSVLVTVQDLEPFLLKLKMKLKHGGKVIFLENARGGVLHALRYFWHRNWDYNGITYFTEREIEIINRIFDGVVVKRRLFPPCFLVFGSKGTPNIKE